MLRHWLPERRSEKSAMRDPICLFGVNMHPLSMRETIAAIDERMRASDFTQHVVVNVAKVVTMQKDAGLRAAVQACDIINIDGAGVVVAGRMLGYEIPERVAGIDLFHELLRYSEHRGKTVFFLGAKPDVLNAAVLRIRSEYPKLRIVGWHHGYFWDDEAATVEQIRESGAELLFVGISSPLKEQFIDRWREQLGVKFAMGVGGSFDVVAGKVLRAPLWMQRLGLEWFYRLAQEPRRMFWRYFSTNTVFAWMLLQGMIRRAVGRHPRA